MLESFLSMPLAQDLAVFTILVAVLIVYGALYGTGRLRSLIIALPIAGFLYTMFPYRDGIINIIPTSLSSVAPLLVFVVFLIISYWILKKIVGPSSSTNGALDISITAFSFATLLIFFSYHVVPIDNLYVFGDAFNIMFASLTNFFWIFTVAIVALFML